MSSLKTIDSNFDRLSRKNKQFHARSRAAFALSMVWEGRSLDEALERVDIEGSRDSGFCQELAYGCCRFNTRIEWYLKKLLDKPLKKEAMLVKAVLAGGIYQLELSHIPTHAAVDMSVRTIREVDLAKFSGLVNAVLRNFERKKESLQEAMPQDIKVSYPSWLIELFKERFEDPWQGLERGNAYPPMTLRLAPKCNIDELSIEVERAEATLEKASLYQDAYWVKPSISSKQLANIGQQYFIQDEAAQLAAVALNPQQEDVILDLCSAPGGKALHLQALAAPNKPICVVEVSKRRINEMRQRFSEANLEFEIIQANAADESLLEGRVFNRILIDAPCSGLGVIRRHPDIKLLRRKEDIAQYSERQMDIVVNAVRLLERGGRLLYCTCTVSKEENEGVMKRILERFDELTEVDLDERYGQRKEVGYQRAPGQDDTDGFYYCLLEKRL